MSNKYFLLFFLVFFTKAFCMQENKHSDKSMMSALRMRESGVLKENKRIVSPRTLKFLDVFSRMIDDESQITSDTVQRLICYMEDHPAATAVFLRQIFGLSNAEKVARELCSNGIMYYDFTTKSTSILSKMVKEYGFNVNYPIHDLFPPATEGLSPLHLVAVNLERVADTRFLIDLGADPLFKAGVDYTPAEGLGIKSTNPYFSNRTALYGEILAILTPKTQ